MIITIRSIHCWADEGMLKVSGVDLVLEIAFPGLLNSGTAPWSHRHFQVETPCAGFDPSFFDDGQPRVLDQCKRLMSACASGVPINQRRERFAATNVSSVARDN